MAYERAASGSDSPGELGIWVFNLYKWGREGAAPRAAEVLRRPGGKEELHAEVERLRLELLRMTKQRDILKNRGHPLRTVAERYARIKALSDEHPAKRISEVFSVSRSGYYTWLKADASLRAWRD